MRRAGAIISEAAAAIQFAVPDHSRPLSFAEIFGRAVPAEVDLGCGDGAFLTALAEQHPERNYLGIEKLFGRIRTGCKRIERAGLTNARLIRADFAQVVASLLPAESVHVFHIMFPDPWPKRRHQQRRVVTPELFGSIEKALMSKGVLHVVTDEREYYQHVLKILKGTPLFESTSIPEESLPRSTFEQRFIDAGDPIYRVRLRKLPDPRKGFASQ